MSSPARSDADIASYVTSGIEGRTAYAVRVRELSTDELTEGCLDRDPVIRRLSLDEIARRGRWLDRILLDRRWHIEAGER
jgi:hypothetical protein